jgi:hypothetical protein
MFRNGGGGLTLLLVLFALFYILPRSTRVDRPSFATGVDPTLVPSGAI